MASERGFSLIEALIAMSIAAIILISGSQLFGVTSERSKTLHYQSELMHQMESLKRQYRRPGEFPSQLESTHDYQLTLESCGIDCRTLRLTPNRSHACRYWELGTDGSMGAGREGCWPESAVRAFAGHSSPS
jgi:prepilin-type N-terminal cleavage/methylation domain-containing protein